MKDFYIEYIIVNKYEQPVRKANFQILVVPDSNAVNSIQDQEVSCSVSGEMHRSKNPFGFEILSIYAGQPFTDFWFKFKARVQVQDINPFVVSPLLPGDEYKQLMALDFQIDNHLFLTSTDLTHLPFGFLDTFPKYSNKLQVFDYLLQLNNYLYRMLEYSPESTDVNTPIEDVLRIRKGVCQDFAHLFISVCRENKIPARYVSGYLDQGAEFLGSGQLHAWVEAYIPELGWVGFDATNNLLADHHYIKIAHGTDYRDCSPIVGVLETLGMQKSTHTVTVTNQ